MVRDAVREASEASKASCRGERARGEREGERTSASWLRREAVRREGGPRLSSRGGASWARLSSERSAASPPPADDEQPTPPQQLALYTLLQPLQQAWHSVSPLVATPLVVERRADLSSFPSLASPSPILPPSLIPPRRPVLLSALRSRSTHARYSCDRADAPGGGRGGRGGGRGPSLSPSPSPHSAYTH